MFLEDDRQRDDLPPCVTAHRGRRLGSSVYGTAFRLPDLAGHVWAVDARVDSIGERLDRFEPSLELLSGSVETLGRAAETLNELVEPLTRLAERIPGRRGRGSRD
jgi:hypothetical protein